MKKKHIKAILIMSTTAFSTLLISCVLTTSLFATNPVEAQDVNEVVISVEYSDATLLQVFSDIENKTEFTFLYNQLPISLSLKRITIKQQTESVGNVLQQIMAQTGLRFYQTNNTLSVKYPEETNALVKLPVATGSITGTVTNEEGQPVPTANVFLVEISKGVATNIEGKYIIENVEEGTYTLRVTFIGYQEYETQVIIESGETLEKNITLHQGAIGLQELVVIGFGKQSKRNVVASISSVEMENIEKAQGFTFTQKLNGKATGVRVVRSSGRLGAPVDINIRGTSSVNSGGQPLYVVDGVPIVNQSIGQGGGVYGVNGSVSSFINLSSNNIESIQILKGAAASAIYGARGSNGVVLVTTKTGSASRQQLSINMSGGFNKTTKNSNLLNGPQYLNVYNYKNQTNYAASDFANTDWQDVVTRTGSFQKYSVNLSGGTENTTYFLSAGYDDAMGYLVGNSLKKYTALIKVNHEFNSRFDIGLRISPSITKNGALRAFGQVGSAYGLAALQPPVVPIFLPDGSVNNGRDPSIKANLIFSPFPGTPYTNVRNMSIDNTTEQALTIVNASYDILSNLTLESDLGYQFFVNLVDFRAKDNTVTGYPTGVVSVSHHSFTNVNWNSTLTYQKEWENNSIEVTVGATFQASKQDNSALTKRNIAINSLTDLNSASQLVGGTGNSTSYAFQNNIARISYNYDGKYLLTLTGSYNGTSRFSEGKRYGFFPAIAAGWIISDENFMENFNSLSFLKLRASYGITGNANIGNFAYLPLLSASVKYFNQPGFVFSQLANSNLTWETTKGFNIGLDYGFFNNRLSGNIAYFRKITTNLLLQRRVSNINGFTSILKNGGKVSNQGIEFNFNFDLLESDDLQWSISGNITTLKNEIKKLPGGQIIGSSNIVREGESIWAFYLPVYQGVDSKNGDALFADGNGGTTSNYSLAPREIVGSPQPDFYGGFGTNFSYKGFSLSAFFNYTYGNKIYWSRAEYIIGGSSVYNQLALVLDYWTPNNKDASIPEPRKSPNGNNTSTRFLEDGSYLRLGSLRIGYTFHNLASIGAKSMRLYIGGTNLLTFTNFRGLDPASVSSSRGVVGGNDPQSLGISGGIQITF